MYANIEKKCPACGEMTKWSRLLSSTTLLHGIYKCEKCHLKSMHPIPTTLLKQGLYENISCSYDDEKAKMAEKSVEYYIALFKEYLPYKDAGLHLVDIGGGLGYYSNAFGLSGINVTYVDGDHVSFDFSKSHQKNINRHIYADTDTFFSETCEKYDVIFCRHLIEHAFFPDKLMKMMLANLNRNGIIILETDNNESSELIMHPDAQVYWRNVYKEDYAVNDFKDLLKLKVTAISERNTHWWAFNMQNMGDLINLCGGKVLFSRHYYLGDPFLWSNIQNYRNITPSCNVHEEKINNYLFYVKSNQGAGMLMIISHA